MKSAPLVPQSENQAEPHADPQADPHDDIVAALRSDAPSPPPTHDPSELHISLDDRAAAAVPPRPPVLRAPLLNDNGARSAPARGARRGGGFARFLLTVALGIAATVGVQAYGEQAQQMLAGYLPQLLSMAPDQAQATTPPEQPPPVQTAGQAAPEKPSPVVEPAAAAPAPAPVQAAPSPELASMIEDMSREIASLRQTIEQLKTGQQQISRDLAKVDKAIEQDARRKTVARTPPPRPAAPPPQRTPSPLPPPIATAAERQAIVPRPPTVTQLPPEPGYVSRPPMPLR